MTVYTDLSVDQLIEHALKRHEGIIAANKALKVETGARTGRSPKDRFIVKESATAANIDWGVVNQPLAPEIFNNLWQRGQDYIQSQDHFISHLHVAADEQVYLPVKVMTTLAWHNLFVKQLFIRPNYYNPKQKSEWTILNVPQINTDPNRDGVNSDAAVILHLTERKILILGTYYAGEMKKSMFSVLNYLLPEKEILPMHCSANVGRDGDTALFFGLSGTGKTTLSADPERFLIGDDEHGWSEQGVFNFEGGCYAKCINLSQKNEPMIFNALTHGAVMENVVLDNDLHPDYTDASLTENTRAAYPLEFIPSRIIENRGAQPKAVIFLTCDLFGVLPPIAKLTPEQAAYHFLSGYTALVGSTEFGQGKGIKLTFSTCFGAPFFPRPPHVYADLLMKRIGLINCPVFLVNTGWTGGAYGEGGERFSIPVTRAIIRAILQQDWQAVEFAILPRFNLAIPKKLTGVEDKLLDPRLTWPDQTAYNQKANQLVQEFQNNFKKFTHVATDILAASPVIIN